MFHLYLIALVGVALAIAASLVEAVLAVSRKPVWQLPRTRMTLVETSDRRHTPMSFVGAERRDANAPEQPAQQSEGRRSA